MLSTRLLVFKHCWLLAQATHAHTPDQMILHRPHYDLKKFSFRVTKI
jgi:hypothetical protein